MSTSKKVKLTNRQYIASKIYCINWFVNTVRRWQEIAQFSLPDLFQKVIPAFLHEKVSCATYFSLLKSKMENKIKWTKANFTNLWNFFSLNVRLNSFFRGCLFQKFASSTHIGKYWFLFILDIVDVRTQQNILTILLYFI